MKVPRQRKLSPDVKFPAIRERQNVANPIMTKSTNLKLQKINKPKIGIAFVDVAKIDKIEKEFTILTKRNQNKTTEDNKLFSKEKETGKKVQNKDEMRESRLLLLKNITPHPQKKQNANLLSSLVSYSPALNPKKITIPSQNITTSPTKQKKQPTVQIQLIIHQVPSLKSRQQQTSYPIQYKNVQQIKKIDFVKMFIVEELLYYISKLQQKTKEEMTGFCKFYNENIADETTEILATVLSKKVEFQQAVFYERLGFYIFLILGTDLQLQQEASFLLKSLTQYMHKNNLIILDMLMQIVDMQKFPVSAQFHVYNTSRFNQDRRKIKYNQDRISLIAKNNKSLVEIIKSILTNCGFDSLKSFVFEILSNEDVVVGDKIKQVETMLVSLDAILTSSLNVMVDRPQPPFLPPLEGNKKYTLVLDMDQTLIHFRQTQNTNNNKQSGLSFLIRPFCQQFLDQMARHYQIVIFTAAVKQYADSILDSLEAKRQPRIAYRLYREHTRLEDFVSIKDLSLLNRDMSKTIIVDNIASNFKLQPRNGIAISTWTGEEDDVALSNLVPVLRKMVVQKVNDVRQGLQKLSQYMQAQISKGQDINFQQISLTGL